MSDTYKYAQRLKQERARLQMSQAALAAACGVAKQTQIGYEHGLRKPDVEYFAGALEAGVDLQFVFTGMTRDEHVVQEFDWKLLGEIIVGILTWCEEHDVTVAPGKWEKLLRHFYGKFQKERKVELVELHQVLSIAA